MPVRPAVLATTKFGHLSLSPSQTPDEVLVKLADTFAGHCARLVPKFSERNFRDDALVGSHYVARIYHDMAQVPG